MQRAAGERDLAEPRAARDGADGGRVGRGTTVQVERLEKRHLEGRGGRVNSSNYRYAEVGYTEVFLGVRRVEEWTMKA